MLAATTVRALVVGPPARGPVEVSDVARHAAVTVRNLWLRERARRRTRRVRTRRVAFRALSVSARSGLVRVDKTQRAVPATRRVVNRHGQNSWKTPATPKRVVSGQDRHNGVENRSPRRRTSPRRGSVALQHADVLLRRTSSDRTHVRASRRRKRFTKGGIEPYESQPGGNNTKSGHDRTQCCCGRVARWLRGARAYCAQRVSAVLLVEEPPTLRVPQQHRRSMEGPTRGRRVGARRGPTAARALPRRTCMEERKPEGRRSAREGP